MPATPANVAVSLVEIVLLLIGSFLLWRHGIRPAARRAAQHTRGELPTWEVGVADFLWVLFVIVGASVVLSFATAMLIAPFKLSTDTKTILNSAAFQLGLLIGPALVPMQLGHPPLRLPLDRSTLRSGFTTFLVALPIITVVNLGWLEFLKFAGLPAEQQDLLRMFEQADSPALLGLLVVLATIVAPIAEELLFRATIFRYVRTRIPRWIALLAPGLIFAALHVDWVKLDGLASFAPLVTLAIVFSLAYERTGRIGTAIVAHALFNLHTIVVLFLTGGE